MFSRIQRGEITIAAGASSGTATIASVNTNKSHVVFCGFRSAETSLATSEDYVRISLTDATTVTAQTNSANASNSRIAGYEVWEWVGEAITSINSGTITLGSVLSNTATIPSVDTDYSFVFHLGHNHTVSNGNFNYNQARIEITDATTITATKSDTNFPSLVVGYVAVESNSDYVASVQQFAITIAESTTVTNQTITAVDDTTSMVIYQGMCVALFAVQDPTRLPYVFRTSTTNLRAQRAGSSAARTIANATVVEFVSGKVTARAAAQTTIASGAASANATIANAGTAILSPGGFSSSANVSTVDGPYTTVKLNSTTQVTVTRGGTPANAPITAWEVLVVPTLGLPPAGSLVLTANASRQSLAYVITAGSLTLSTLAPSLRNSAEIPEGELALTGFAPSLTLRLPVPAEDLSLTGIASSYAQGYAPPLGELELSVLAPTLEVNYAVPAGELELATQSPGLKADFPVPAGSLALTSQISVAKNTYVITVGELELTGNAPVPDIQFYVVAPLGTIYISLPAATYELQAYTQKTGEDSSFSEKAGASSTYYEKGSAFVPDTFSITLETKESSHAQGYGIVMESLALSAKTPVSTLKYIIPAGSITLTGQVPTV